MNTTGFSALDPSDWYFSSTAGNTSDNNTDFDSSSYSDVYIDWDIFHLVMVLICLLGLVGNGAVIWLLSFRVKRNPFSVYILNLAMADFTFLIGNSIWAVYYLLPYDVLEFEGVLYSFYLSSIMVDLSLLMAVSTERCVSVLCPLWYRCHRPAHLSSILCALIWGLGSCLWICEILCNFFSDIVCIDDMGFKAVVTLLTFLVLCVSSLTLLIRVQCSSRKRQPSRLYLTILLSVLAFLLLGLPHSVSLFVFRSNIISPYADIIDVMSRLLLVLNSVVNPVIYFFVGRLRQPGGRKPLWEVLQRALMDEEEGAEQGRGVPVPSQDSLCP
ncbi:mas-related G-protein coupled receptor member A6-like [Erinaceus europaeus]|uniref:Mas-related G-protein coupled receptor member A6-like n=1 Tax=Erinaceus europaeus TaxID=9365 RepID=A0A1S2ZFZ8_ERIEU|nr:mas-related G-protein coupled receptor member A6-like [Erinaceus europaeus]